ncbi:MAG: BsuPI-related putative proteinase inhibitor [Bacteroidota bacterium]
MNTSSVLLIGLLFVSGCGLLGNDENVSSEITLSSSRERSFNELDARFLVTNNIGYTVNYEFGTGCQVAFEIHSIQEDETRLEYDSTERQVCTDALSGIELEDGDLFELTLEVPSTLELDEGDYEILGFLIGYRNEVRSSASFTIGEPLSRTFRD